MEVFPAHDGLPEAVIEELKDEFSYGLSGMFLLALRYIRLVVFNQTTGLSDYTTSQTSMFPYDAETVTTLSKCLDRVKGLLCVGHRS